MTDDDMGGTVDNVAGGYTDDELSAMLDRVSLVYQDFAGQALSDKSLELFRQQLVKAGLPVDQVGLDPGTLRLIVTFAPKTEMVDVDLVNNTIRPSTKANLKLVKDEG
jgi:hypothetical protein